jgi:hypothetical protein
MSLVITGNTGEIGSLELYCGVWGAPESQGGFVTTSYAAGTKVLTCAYTFASNVVATITWSGGSTSSSSSSSSSESGTPLLLKVTLDLPQFAFQNSMLNGTVAVSWTGTMQVYLAHITMLATDANYTVSVPGGLPFTLMLSYNASNVDVVPFYLSIPSDVSVGEHQIPFDVDVYWMASQTKTYRIVAYITVQKQETALVLPAPSDLITILFVAMFAALIIPILFRTQRARAQRSRSL